MPRPSRFGVLFPACVAFMIGGCAANPAPKTQSQPADQPAAPQQSAETAVLAYVNSEAVTLRAVRRPLLEAAGGQTLAEVVLDRMLHARLEAAGLSLTPERIEAERDLLTQTLQPRNDDEATLIVQELRRRRGLGDQRFLELLRRNAAMRMLVQNQVQTSPDALQRAYRLTYGEKYHARVITVPTLADANRLRALLAAGEADFAHLAVTRSTDPSAVQGGLLPPISPADPAFPAIVRDTLVKLDEQGRTLSDAIALDSGYALLKLERKVTPDAVEFTDVKDELAEQVRRSAERVLMQQLARELLAEADVVVLDPALQQSWERQTDAMLGP